MEVSIVIPTYNGHHQYIQKCVSSIDEDCEIIIVNDSTKPLNEVFFDRDVVIHNREINEPYGAGKGRNIGVRLATKPVIIFMDSDDYFMPNAISIMYKAYQKHSNIIFGSFIRSDNNKTYVPTDFYCGKIVAKSELTKSNMTAVHLIERGLYLELGGQDETLPFWEDVEWAMKLYVKGYCPKKLDNILYYYNFHTGVRRKEAKDKEKYETVKAMLYNKYREYYEKGVNNMACQKCNDKVIPPNNTNVVSKDLTLSGEYDTHIVFIDNKPSFNALGTYTQTHYRFRDRQPGKSKKVVNHDDFDPNHEVHLNDALSFINLNMNNIDTFKVERTFVEVKEIKEVVKTVLPTVINNPVNDTKLATDGDLPSMEDIMKGVKERLASEIDHISKFSIPNMKKQLQSKTKKAYIEIWLEQEAESEKPRKGMLDILNEYI